MKSLKFLVTVIIVAGLVGSCEKKDHTAPRDPDELSKHHHHQKEYSGWSVPVNMGSVINSSANDQHPFLSKDGLSLYFSSNRQGTTGQLDIWVSQRESVDSPWGTPQNLGLNINSN